MYNRRRGIIETVQNRNKIILRDGDQFQNELRQTKQICPRILVVQIVVNKFFYPHGLTRCTAYKCIGPHLPMYLAGHSMWKLWLGSCYQPRNLRNNLSKLAGFHITWDDTRFEGTWYKTWPILIYLAWAGECNIHNYWNSKLDVPRLKPLFMP